MSCMCVSSRDSRTHSTRIRRAATLLVWYCWDRGLYFRECRSCVPNVRHPATKSSFETSDNFDSSECRRSHGEIGFSIISRRIFPFEGNLTDVAYLEWPWDPLPPTINFGEYLIYGPGLGVRNRVKWVSFNHVMSYKKAKTFSVDVIINQEGWFKETCVPYNGSF